MRLLINLGIQSKAPCGTQNIVRTRIEIALRIMRTRETAIQKSEREDGGGMETESEREENKIEREREKRERKRKRRE